ncbi:MAG: DNA-directed RNA polymerase subunit H [Thermoplasmata archaeon]|nr:MAG: DNA-directed RNA polymerase subunit H [Thermoplasmata archaeon]
MKIDILKHTLVPHHEIHEILSAEEVEKLLKTYKIKKEDLPQILVTDPVVKAIGAKEGDVIKIIRRSPTAGESVAYRLVVRKEII